MTRHLPLLLLLLLGALVLPAPAQAAPCSGRSGVTVLVQYDTSRIQVGCAPGDPSSGYDALSAAGFHVTPAQGTGAGAVCRINSYPSGANCGAMPPANAYWAYFHARPGGSWSYSTEGGGTYDPAPGTVEGWRFNSGDGVEKRPPSVAPPSGPAATPTRKPTTKTSRTPSSRPTATATATTTPSPTATPTARPTRKHTAALAAPVTTPAATPQTFAEPGPVDADVASSAGGGTSWIWGVVLVGLVAAVGTGVALRRRRG